MSNQQQQNDTLERLEAMISQEDSIQSCYNYIRSSACIDEIDEDCRKSMVVWCQAVQKALQLHPETVWIATSYFDRYLSSGKGKSQDVLQNKYKFQLAAITCFYIAVKINEPVELDVETLAKLCKGYYAESKILAMETDILFALEWRVSCPTPMDFVREFVQLLPTHVKDDFSESFPEESLKLCEQSSKDFFFTFCKPSVVAASCIASCLTGTDVLSKSERQAFWMELGRITDLIEVMEAQNKLFEGKQLVVKSVPVAKKTSRRSSISKKVAAFSKSRKSAVVSPSSSPVCVTQTARQA